MHACNPGHGGASEHIACARHGRYAGPGLPSCPPMVGVGLDRDSLADLLWQIAQHLQ